MKPHEFFLSMNTIYKLKNISASEILIVLLAIFCFSYSLYVAINYATQIPLDLHSFRQTQTALTAYWLVKNGFSFAYETPVAGPPWSIPFEFPLYQYIVALASQITKYSLNATGRVVSFLFLALCLIPARSITKNLNLSQWVFYIFAALLFSSPLYLYWGRTFMIETAAVFFSIAAIKYFIDIVQAKNTLKNSFLFLGFISLSILQKATTGLPVLALLSFAYVLLNIKDAESLKAFLLSKKIMLALVYFGIPLLIGIAWTLYTDQIKSLNDLGIELTSSALTTWNWGSMSQRLSTSLYSEVIGKRLFERNLSGALGIAILMIALFSHAKKSVKSIIAISILMGLLPLFLFTNLHIVHTYYQTGNLIFIIYAVSVAIGHILMSYFEKKIILFILAAIMVASNYFWFSKDYLAIIKTEFNKANSRDYAVSEILKREIPEEKYFVAFGNRWSSSFAYLAERKSFTVPESFKQYEKISLNPEYFIKETQLGGIVVCLTGVAPNLLDTLIQNLDSLIQWSSNNRHWKIGQTHGCFLAFPEAVALNPSLKLSSTKCEGSIDVAGESQAGKRNYLNIAGWTTISGKQGILSEKVYVTLTKNSEPVFFETVQVNRPDVNTHFGRPNLDYSGFSRIINTNSLAGEYVVGVARLNQGFLEQCQFQKKVSLNNKGFNE
ncbi:conserved membrane hypothetical protein [Candidatus Methylobacter favarea]|uniref:ArnT-like N-terminal domain-containing protein n=1 Tax=Candidatus Methylobacter favarea TaxID=2707345 RepID=A0A8S0XSJ0_9GAMM|nr:phospholipid carrier-dependent glycosyltransferase [Candidatus Methylobacter favarea]CAA9890802.1 conserved membrane hypothetical protein [Candidatus Methylobacter favarea]